MAGRKRQTQLADLAKARGCDPGEYLIGRMRLALDAEDHEQAQGLAMFLMPYCRRKLAPEPVEEVKDAMARGRLLIIGAGVDQDPAE